MPEVKWIKITTDIFDDEKILLIESLPDADSIIVIWFKLLCLAGKMNNSGVFVMNDTMAYSDSMLATIFRRKEATVKLALDTFEQFGMIQMIDGAVTIPNWGKHQSLDQLEKKRIRQKEYMREYRQKQREITCKANGKTNVSRSEEEKDKNKKENKNTIKRAAAEKIYFPGDESLNQAFLDYLEMRRQIKKPMTEKAIELAIKKLEELSVLPFSDSMDNDLAIQILNQSVMNSWQGLFPLKEQKTVCQDKKGGAADGTQSGSSFKL